MSGRGTYGRSPVGGTSVGADPQRGSSWGTWIIGGLLVGGAVLWAKHQADQIEKLYATAGLPYQGFTRSLRLRAGELSTATGEKLQGLGKRLGSRKELSDGT